MYQFKDGRTLTTNQHPKQIQDWIDSGVLLEVKEEKQEPETKELKQEIETKEVKRRGRVPNKRKN